MIGYWGKNKIVARAAMYHNPKSVLDVGCGTGKIVNLLRNEGIDAWGIDIAEEKGEFAPEYCVYGDAINIPFEDNRFDVVVSNDFMEHIAEENIDKVYSEMKRVAKHVIARICIKPYRYHLTVKPISWWKEKLPGCEFVGKDWQ